MDDKRVGTCPTVTSSTIYVRDGRDIVPEAVGRDRLPERAVERRHLLRLLEQPVPVEHDKVAEPVRYVAGVVGAEEPQDEHEQEEGSKEARMDGRAAEQVVAKSGDKCRKATKEPARSSTAPAVHTQLHA